MEPNSSVFVPFTVLETINQKPSKCVCLEMLCEKHSDCDNRLKNRNVASKTCSAISSLQGDQYGCVMDTWCPCENILSGVTTKYEAREFFKAIIKLDSYQDYDGKVFKNNKDVISFPAEQANYFELENILKSIGFSDKSLYDIGGIIRLVSHWECDDILFLPISKLYLIKLQVAKIKFILMYYNIMEKALGLIQK